MLNRRFIPALLIILTFMACLTGCSDLGRGIDLKGQRKTGVDEYVGSYEASYTRFNGKEYIFGGTLLERENGTALKATYSLKIESGTAALYWLSSPESHIRR